MSHLVLKSLLLFSFLFGCGNQATEKAETLYHAAVEHAREGQYLEVIVSCQAALDIDPNHVEARLLLGSTFLKQGKLEEAVTECRHAISLEPKLVEARIALGDVFVRQRLNDEALAAYQEAVRLAPEDPHPYRKLAIAYTDQSRYSEAVETLLCQECI